MLDEEPTNTDLESGHNSKSESGTVAMEISADHELAPADTQTSSDATANSGGSGEFFSESDIF
jgi:hypothetical protein